MKICRSYMSLMLAICTLIFLGCNKNKTPINNIPQNPCPEQFPCSPVEIDSIPKPDGKIIFSAVLDSSVYDSIYNSWYQPRILFAISPDGSTLQQIANFEFMLRLPTLSPEGNLLVYTSWKEAGAGIGTEYVFLLNITDSTTTRLTKYFHEPRSFSWSPDGNMIAFIACVDCEAFGYNNEIFVIDLQQDTVFQFTHTPGSETIPFWSPDGKRFIFGYQDTKGWDLYIGNPYTGQTTRITCTPGSQARAIWAPDGCTIIIESQSSLFQAHLNAFSRWEQIGNGQLGVYNDWSPDGRTLVFNSRNSIYLFNLETHEKTVLLQLPISGFNIDFIETVQWLPLE